MIVDKAEILRPADRLTVWQAAERWRYLNTPAYVGPYNANMSPYAKEVMECLTDRTFRSVILTAPAQSGKTDIVLNWIGHTVKCDPSDFILYEKSQSSARDFSMTKYDRMHRYSPGIASELERMADSDNTYDKHYKSGMIVSVSWPAINTLTGKSVRFIALTDYDRWPTNIGGEGEGYALAIKRMTSFKAKGKIYCESSIGFEVSDPTYLLKSPHEAPPANGIITLYNSGDRRRRYWKCWHCRQWFEPTFALLTYPKSEDIMESAESVLLACPHCGGTHTPDNKLEMDIQGKWVKDNCRINENDEIVGNPPRTNIASFWLKGPAAPFARWQDLVIEYINAEKKFENTGDEEALRTCVNASLNEPYYPRSVSMQRRPEDIKATARADLAIGKVPDYVRVLLAQIDVQKGQFIVQVHGVSEGNDITVIDRFSLYQSNRTGHNGERLQIDTGAYLEDWDILLDEVINKTYPLQKDENRKMAIKFTVCDSGGKDGVTKNAYNFWRKLRDQSIGERFLLLKGEPKREAPRIKISYPDSQRKDRTANARGEIPVLMINSNSWKDSLNNALDRTASNGGRIIFPAGLSDRFYSELTVETKTSKGWENLAGRRNESWDLLAYCMASIAFLGMETMDWDNPPGWAADQDTNDLVTGIAQESAFVKKEKAVYDMAKLGASLG